MTAQLPLTPAVALAHFAPEILDSLSELERVCLPYFFDLWLRPNQRIPRHDWRTFGAIAGRGYGKSLMFAAEINRRVREGEARHLGLMAPNEDRCEEVQISFLVDTSPPWFKAERYRGGVRWPNGVQAICFTPEAPDGPRSENIELSWLCEIVGWQPSTRVEAFNNIMTATRVGRSQVFWDTTSKGKNVVILSLMKANAEDPIANPILRGTSFDNPMLTQKYLRDLIRRYPKGTRAHDEEVKGLVFAEAAGALWEQLWIDTNRVPLSPPHLVHRIVAMDPALTNTPESDETGIVAGGTAPDGDVYVQEDLSERYDPDEWGDIAVAQCIDKNAAGVIIETNRHGDGAKSTIQSRARERGWAISVIPRGSDKPIPRRTPGTIHVKEVFTRDNKADRAAPAAVETEHGHVHLVGPSSKFEKLELELTTWVPGERGAQSPNRLDAFSYLVNELRGLGREDKAQAAKAAVADAAKIQEQMRRAIGSTTRARRVGL